MTNQNHILKVAQMNQQDKINSEKNYHNQVFSGKIDNRSFTSKFYRMNRSSSDYYNKVLQSEIVGKSVLEFGCGVGANFPIVSEKAKEYCGVDISDEAIKIAKGRYGEAFIVDDCEALKIDQKFDLIFGSSILHHLDNEKACNSLTSKLNPSGKILFLEPLGKNPLINFYRRITPNQRTPDEHPFVDKDIQVYKKYFNLKINYFSLFNVLSLPFLNLPIGEKLYEITDRIDQNLRHILGPNYCKVILHGDLKN